MESRHYIRYIRGENGKKLGAIALYEQNGYFGIGVSLCHPNDAFDKSIARQIAQDRAYDCYSEQAYSYFELVNFEWYGEIMDTLPDSDRSIAAVDAIISAIADITNDFAKNWFKHISAN